MTTTPITTPISLNLFYFVKGNFYWGLITLNLTYKASNIYFKVYKYLSWFRIQEHRKVLLTMACDSTICAPNLMKRVIRAAKMAAKIGKKTKKKKMQFST